LTEKQWCIEGRWLNEFIEGQAMEEHILPNLERDHLVVNQGLGILAMYIQLEVLCCCVDHYTRVIGVQIGAIF
jgi:hypothetical protein